MPVLNTQRKKITIELPKTKAKVIVWDELLAGDFRQITEKTDFSAGAQVSGDTSFQMILKLIVEWDLTNEANEPLPINMDSIDLLPLSDLTILANHVGKVSKESTTTPEVKKN